MIKCVESGSKVKKNLIWNLGSIPVYNDVKYVLWKIPISSFFYTEAQIKLHFYWKMYNAGINKYWDGIMNPLQFIFWQSILYGL